MRMKIQMRMKILGWYVLASYPLHYLLLRLTFPGPHDAEQKGLLLCMWLTSPLYLPINVFVLVCEFLKNLMF